MTDNAHAKLSPSSAHRWMRCPSAPALSEGIPDTASSAAAEGTFAHEIAASCLEERKPADAFIGVASDDGEFEFTADMAEHVQTYVDACDTLGMIHHPGKSGRYGRLIERKVRIESLAPDISGTADFAQFAIPASGRGSADVADLKFGQGTWVNHRNNPQLRIYALGVLLSDDVSGRGVEEMRLHIVQPRHHSGDPWRTEVLKVSELLAWMHDELLPAADLARNAGPTDNLVAGAWCKWCPAKLKCPAIREEAFSAAADVFSDVATLAPAATPPQAADLTTTDVAQIFAAKPLVDEWFKAVSARAYDLARAGVQLPGFKLVQKLGNRVWTDETAMLDLLTDRGVLDAYTHPEPKLIGPAEAERRLAARGVPKALAKRLVSALTEKPVTGETLVPSDSDRPQLDPGGVFK